MHASYSLFFWINSLADLYFSYLLISAGVSVLCVWYCEVSYNRLTERGGHSRARQTADAFPVWNMCRCFPGPDSRLKGLSKYVPVIKKKQEEEEKEKRRKKDSFGGRRLECTWSGTRS